MSFALDEKLIAEMDQKRGALSRSAWIRVAIVRMLGLNDDVARPPEREGLSRGGKPTHKVKAAEPTLVAAAEETAYKIDKSKRKKA